MKSIIFIILIFLSINGFAIDKSKSYKCRHIGISKVTNKRFKKVKPCIVPTKVISYPKYR